MPVSAHISDEELMLKLRDGDPKAGDVLAERHYSGLNRYFRRMVNCAHVADDLHQETWANVLTHADRFSELSASGGFKAWLFRIASNKLIDHWRQQRRDKRIMDAISALGEETAPDASALLEITEEWIIVRNAIDRLSTDQQQIVLLRLEGKLTFKEIAEALGCALGTATSRMNKAIKRLRRLLE